MSTISTSLFLKNEGQTIRRCLDSCLPFTDQFVIGVDNSCTDNTEEEVKKFIEDNPTEDIVFYKFDWKDSFAYHRNEGMDKCTSEWILVMDGHEYFPESWKNITENRIVNSQQVMTMLKSHLTSEGLGNDNDKVRGTRWAIYNGVTEYLDHHKAYKGSEDNREFSSLLGGSSRIRERAFAMLTR